MVALVCDKHRTAYSASGECASCRLEEVTASKTATTSPTMEACAGMLLKEEIQGVSKLASLLADSDAMIADALGMRDNSVQVSPDEVVRQVTRAACAEFASILWQVVQQRTADAVEGMARMSQPEVGEKLAQTPEQMLREYMLDIGVAREAARMLQDITEGKS